ncbi:CPBP family intramembrane metalloprotease [Mucilaginibacter sp. Bleaf8]|uniref:CPBP family intramembrane glutamic endopeptidase n=1 Tax=Mucilaginibacter sp. Bleaf8 TaxID=2834430 RepID=UPI001BCDD403|nr:CPBP family intramembrane glutamic endopeptidase [Mucilaginibacter sp. Bleaf8]MBS7564392.1 CPBP family intramembrane metalloprotease [Mucilaginibacter sp. Bleaf8]
MIPGTPHKRTPLSPSLQFAILILLTISILIAGNFISMAVIAGLYGTDTFNNVISFNPNAPHIAQGLWILQIISTTIPLFITPIIFSMWIVREPQTYLKSNFKFNPFLMVIVLAIMYVSLPVMEEMIRLNQQMQLPDSLKNIENWMRNMENAAQKATAVMLRMNTIGDLITALLVIGLFTAIAEEFLFRGCMQTIFVRWTNNQHVAIWITATLFSAFHMEFFGFVPRLMLGVLFGYFAAWSGSIWPAVWAHFLNNGSAVLITYLYQHKQVNINPDADYTFSYSTYALSVIITVLLMLNYRNVALNKPYFKKY